GARRAHCDFYRGFSLLFSVTVLLLAVPLWQLARLARRDSAGARPLVASLFLAYLGFTILCGVYFFIAPAAFSAAVAICLALAFTSARDRKSTRLNSSHDQSSYPVFCLKKKTSRPQAPVGSAR